MILVDLVVVVAVVVTMVANLHGCGDSDGGAGDGGECKAALANKIIQHTVRVPEGAT